MLPPTKQGRTNDYVLHDTREGANQARVRAREETTQQKHPKEATNFQCMLVRLANMMDGRDAHKNCVCSIFDQNKFLKRSVNDMTAKT